MFESAELGHAISKTAYESESPGVRESLVQAQVKLARDARFPVVILLGGVDGAGRGETLNLLSEWMDPRFIQSHGMGDPSDEELDRPMMWRFWRAFPPKGRTGVFLGSWYTWPILNSVKGQSSHADLLQSLERANAFERMLVAEGALVIKFWLHLSREKQEQRLKILERDPKTKWRVTERDWQHHKLYEKFHAVHEVVIRNTDTPEAPWVIVEGFDARYRNLTVCKVILDALEKRLADPLESAPKIPTSLRRPAVDNLDILRKLDLSKTLDKKKFQNELEEYQGKLAGLTRDPRFKKITVVAVFEGNDAAGKGGAIRRITAAQDARFYTTIPIAAPTEEERAQPYLWRFWRHIPRRGRLSIFDRSWYGRVLVERVEEFCSQSDWARAYSEINAFEAQLVRHSIVVSKFWLTISKDEQLARFKAREEIGFKRFKITEEDWRNRNKWDDYERAVCDMVDHTSTEIAPWTLVEANDKRYARIKILKTICRQIESAIEMVPRVP
ncbi:MAG: polyphosphate:AMP phosphotransferase [Comamonadaceae bacterium]